MTTQPTDDQSLKLFLAGALKEGIWHFAEGNDKFYWNDGFTNHEIKDTEWDCIARLVEETLTNDQHVYFRLNLRQITESRVKTYSENLRAYVSAGWRQRAKALINVLKV